MTATQQTFFVRPSVCPDIYLFGECQYYRIFLQGRRSKRFGTKATELVFSNLAKECRDSTKNSSGKAIFKRPPSENKELTIRQLARNGPSGRAFRDWWKSGFW